MAELIFKHSFSKAIYRIIRDYGFTSCLELGSFDGDGSTQILIQALSKAPHRRLVCIEAMPERFKNLVKNTQDYPWVENHCCSTISSASFSFLDFDNDIWNTPFNKLSFQHDEVKGWWERDLAYLKGVSSGYLESSHESFDAVLIDGGEFCGYDEFRLIKDRTKCLMLDDVFFAFKNNRVHQELLQDKEWKLVYEDHSKERNGTSIFVRSDLKPLCYRRPLTLFRSKEYR